MTSSRPAQIHYLRENKGERTPHRLLVLDAESNIAETERGELHTLRLWCMRRILRHDRQPAEPREADMEGRTVDELVAYIGRAVSAKETTWLFVHNLNYELALMRLPLALVRDGWELRTHNLASEAPWAHFAKGKRSLRLADSASWLPLSNERIANLLHLQKPRLPEQDAPEAVWLARCWADVEITATAVCRLMDIWDRLKLGWWSLTGPGTGWNSMLHMNRDSNPGQWRNLERREGFDTPHPAGERTVINPDPVARAFEREAIYSGRRDLWKTGHLPPGPYVELDMANTHLSICAAYPLPSRRIKVFNSLELTDWRVLSEVVSVVARCRVRVERPRYPLRTPRAVLHPVGEFETVLCGPELADAARRGELVSIGQGYVYRLSDQMQPWANWALHVLGDNSGATDPLLQAMVKSWGRSVPGRWGMMISREADKGDSFVSDWALELATTGTPPRRAFIFHFDHHWTELVRDSEWDDSFPAVLAHIQSWCRLLLNRALDAIPEAELVSCNTEGVWTTEAALGALAARQLDREPVRFTRSARQQRAEAYLSAITSPISVRVKQRAASLRVLSPQHLVIDGEPHHAGVPRSATATGGDRYEFFTWPKLRGQIEHGDPAGYVRLARSVDLSSVTPSRWVYADGCCEPVQVAWCAEDGNRLLGPDPLGCRAHGAALRPAQHSAIRAALTPGA